MIMDLAQIIPTDHWEYVLQEKQTVDVVKPLQKTPEAGEVCVLIGTLKFDIFVWRPIFDGWYCTYFTKYN